MSRPIWSGGGGGGASTFVGLTDTPANFTGAAGQIAAVNSGETAVEFITNNARFSVIKNVDETVNNSSTLQDDDELTFSALANKSYLLILFLCFKSASTTPSYKYAFSIPSGATALNGGTAIYLRGGILYGLTTDATVAVAEASSSTLQAVGYMVRVQTAGTPGAVTLQWAQNLATAEDTTTEAGSSLLVWES